MVDAITHKVKDMYEESKEYISDKSTTKTNNIIKPQTDYIYEYNANVRPKHRQVPLDSFPCEQHWLDNGNNTTADLPWDLSKQQDLDIQGNATCANLLCGYLRIKPNDSIEQQVNASSLSCYIIRGSGHTVLADNTTLEWNEGDLFVIPAQTAGVKHYASAESQSSEHVGVAIYYVHDAPLLEYLAVKTSGTRFQPQLFTKATLRGAVNKLKDSPDAAKKNRLGILLGNKATPHTLTITHTLWALFNVIPPKSVQRPHRHNAVALDLATDVHPESEGKVYTLIGNEIDENGNIVNPTKVCWKSGQAFTTPLGLWHQHQNDSEHEAWVLPIQDAGLMLHLGAYDIRFSEEEREHIKAGQTQKGILI